MAGIVSYGAYVPIYRLKRDDIAKAWASRSPGGERSVANADEDSVTMAVGAVRDCLKGHDRSTVDAIFFATTTSPYSEKQMAVTIAAACDLRDDIFTTDVTSCLRAGTLALKAAIDAVASGSARQALVVAADCRLGEPKSEMEMNFGDGAAAFLIGNTDVMATLDASYNEAHEIYDVWRTRKDELVKTWEDRYVIVEGYSSLLEHAIGALLKKTKLTMKDFNKVIFYAPDGRSHNGEVKTLKLEKEQVQDCLASTVGNTGTALALMMLVGALETAQPGQRFLLANYGDGADAYSISTHGPVTKTTTRRGLKGHLASKRYLLNYEKYIRFRELMPIEKQRRPTIIAYVPSVHRDRKWIYNGFGSHCKACDRLFFPPQRVCNYCQTKDKWEYVRIMDWPAILFTYSMDYNALSPDPPTVWTIVDVDKKVRVYTRMTDFDPDKIEVNMPLEMTFRKIHDGGDHPNYFWKSVPIR